MMSVQSIVLYSTHPELLRRKSEAVQNGLDDVGQLVADLKDTLLRHPNAGGLAAPQIGVHRRVIVVRLGGAHAACLGGPYDSDHERLLAVINPVVVEAASHLPHADGCLSLPGIYAKTVRPHFVRLHGIDEHGSHCEWTLDGFDAVAVHHEVDHLNGILFVDKVDGLDRLFGKPEAWTR